jgi:hypothetical protein
VPTRANPSRNDPARVPAPASAWAAVVTALFLTRFLVPAEGVEQGHSLWIATLWLGAAGVWCWWTWRSGAAASRRIDLFDGCVAVLVLSHVLSATWILLGQGDKRAALNSLWEWLSLLATLWLLRSVLISDAARRLFSNALLVSAVALAGLGFWQHFVWYPSQARDVDELFSLQVKLDQPSGVTETDRRRY